MPIIKGALRQITGGIISHTLADHYVLMAVEPCANGVNSFPADNWEALEADAAQEFVAHVAEGVVQGKHDALARYTYASSALMARGHWS